MIEKVNMGVSESRIQQGEPPYFVNGSRLYAVADLKHKT